MPDGDRPEGLDREADPALAGLRRRGGRIAGLEAAAAHVVQAWTAGDDTIHDPPGDDTVAVAALAGDGVLAMSGSAPPRPPPRAAARSRSVDQAAFGSIDAAGAAAGRGFGATAGLAAAAAGSRST